MDRRNPSESLEQLARLAGGFPAGPTDPVGILRQLAEAFFPSRAPAAADPAEASPRPLEKMYRTLVERIPVITFMASLDAGHRELYVSPQIEKILGFTQEEWLSDPVLWFRQLHPEDQERCAQEFARGCMTGGPFRLEFRVLTRDRRVVWLHGEAYLVRDETGQPRHLQGVAYDITESKKSWEAARESQERLEASLREKETLLREIEERERWFRDLLESAPDAIVIVDAGGTITLANAQAEALFGYASAELVGKPVELLVPARFRHRHETHRTGYARDPRWRPMGAGRELFGRRKNGTEFPVEISLSPIRSVGGDVVASAIRDVTDRRRAQEELARRATELERTNAELGQFAYIASHHLQEPSRIIANYLDLLRKKNIAPLDPEASEYLEVARNAAVRMRSLLQDVLDYSRLGGLGDEIETVDAREVVDLVLADLRDTILALGATVHVGALPGIPARRVELRTLFQNLVENALRFRREEPPEIRIEARRTDTEWLFSVADRGIGIPKEQHERIFRMFQRLHPAAAGPGTGIGLALCKKIVEGLAGRIWVDSTPGEGSVFYFTAPAAGTARSIVPPGTTGIETAPPPLPEETPAEIEVLIVEDNPGDVRLIIEALRETSSSVHVSVATDGLAAVEKLRPESGARGGPLPQVIFLDLNLPKLSGWEVIAELRRDQTLSTIPVIILSGSNRKADRDRAEELRVTHYICKPDRYEDLVEAIRSVEHVWQAPSAS